MILLECGISQVSSREFAVRMDNATIDCVNSAQLLFSLERIYWGASISAGLVLFALADVITRRWLSLDSQSYRFGIEAIYGAGAIFAIQFPGALYRCFLANSNKQVVLNSIVVTAMIGRHLTCVLLLFIWPTLFTYLIWQFIAVGIETFTRSQYSWKFVDTSRRNLRWDYNKIKPVLMSSRKMSAAVILGPLTSQMDKLFLSWMVPIEQFGYYVIASTLANGVLQVIQPLVLAVSPRIMQSISDPVVLRQINVRLMIQILSVCLWLVSFVVQRTLSFGKHR